MWRPRRLTTLWASSECYMDSFTVQSDTLMSSFHEGLWGSGDVVQRITMNSLKDAHDYNAYMTGHV
jgi:hypothetical protein